jgi:hypothetical protein
LIIFSTVVFSTTVRGFLAGEETFVPNLHPPVQNASPLVGNLASDRHGSGAALAFSPKKNILRDYF